MQNIVINEDFLKKLQAKYVEQVDTLESMPGKIFAYGNLKESHVDVQVPFTMRLGGSDFAASVEAVNRLNGIREGLVKRLESARSELRYLEYAIEYLLADAEAVEQLNTLSAEQFEYFVPKS